MPLERAEPEPGPMVALQANGAKHDIGSETDSPTGSFKLADNSLSTRFASHLKLLYKKWCRVDFSKYQSEPVSGP